MSVRETTLPRGPEGPPPVGPPQTTYLRVIYPFATPLALRLADGSEPHDAAAQGVVPLPVGHEVVLGRDPKSVAPSPTPRPRATVVLERDGWASRQHTRVSWGEVDGEDAIVVEDLASRNGTWVDGVRIGGPTVVLPGQVVRVGSTLFILGRTALAEQASFVAAHPLPAGFVAFDPATAQLWRRLVAVAASDEPAVIVGEIGSGKTHVARLLHQRSRRASGPFVPMNSSAIPPNLEDATLFGVAPGFIPGVTARAGLLGQAEGGTLFLDEFADLPAPAQAKLLDAFDPSQASYLPVGGPKRVPTRCRLIVSVQRDVFELVASGRIRHDLASRLAVARLDVPPLRERREDVLPLFAEALRRIANADAATHVSQVEIAEALVLARWTENVRGLESLARRIAVGEVLDVALVNAHAGRGGPTTGSAPRPIEVGAAAPPSAASPVASQASAPIIWPPEPHELLELLARHDFAVTPVADLFGRTRETVGRHLTKVFGPGGKDTIKKTYRVWRTSGRVPPPDEVDAVYAQLFGLDPG